jgi:hypothetical protein
MEHTGRLLSQAGLQDAYAGIFWFITKKPLKSQIEEILI